MKNKKGFTLIELLAVIVILGLLMAIAIPSVTKYITQSRKKTVTTTIGNYISALTNQVNDMEYTFTATNTVYAVPIECIALERGGTNPFGKWHQASNSYWAYVLVQYDDTTSSYTYGFTFKDSAGYGLYPTTSEKLNESGSQIQTGLNLNRPTGDSITNITTKENWTGFKLDDDTNLVVLEATSEGETGNGKTTCTLCQKGNNYAQVEEEKNAIIETALYFGKPYEINYDGISESYIFYENGSMDYYYDCELDWSEPEGTFKYDGNQIVFVEDDEIWFNISNDKKKISDAWDEEYVYTINQSSNWCVDPYADLPMLRKQSDSMAFWQYSTQIKNVTFQNSINIPSNVASDHKWDMTRSQNGKVMAYITPNLSDSSYYDLYIQGDGKIYANPNSSRLFFNFNHLDSINGIEVLNTSYVTNMSQMFYYAGYNSSVFTLDLGNNFDTSNVTNMRTMFAWTGTKCPVFALDLGDKFNTSNVTNMSSMFYNAGYHSKVFTLDLGDKFDTSNVTSMQGMFAHIGVKTTIFTLDLGDKFNTSNVTNMQGMFMETGGSSSEFKLNLGDKFNTSNVTDMYGMFSHAGENAITFNIGDLSNWNTSNVTSVGSMFAYAGYKATWSLDCSKWDVSKVTSYSNFNNGVTTKVKAPTWKK